METPKEKAIELVSKMRRDNEMPYQYAIQCALIAVDNTINAMPFDYDFTEKFIEYWQQVKQEIINL